MLVMVMIHHVLWVCKKIVKRWFLNTNVRNFYCDARKYYHYLLIKQLIDNYYLQMPKTYIMAHVQSLESLF